MPEVLSITSTDWELTIWTRDHQARKERFARTMLARGQADAARTAIKFHPPVPLSTVEVEGLFVAVEPVASAVALGTPILFENTFYEFEFVFSKHISGTPTIEHRLRRINDAFRYTEKHGINSLRGSINTGNDIGWLRLPVCYVMGQETKRFSVSIEVYPTKMDMASDIQVIYQKIDAQYPLWRFALAEQTQQEVDRSESSRQSFPLLWLAQFEALQEHLLEGVRHIVRSPHSRLVSDCRMVKADKLKGRVSNRLAERVFSDLASGLPTRRYRVVHKKLSVDTPENRFIKMVLEKSRDNLARFIELARRADEAPDENRLSSVFFQTLRHWRQNLEKQLAHPLFGEVGSFSGMSSESLVLHQKSGYSAIYRSWQKLKMYMAVLGRHASVSMKSIAELYELWCFLTIRDLLLGLGFREDGLDQPTVEQRGLENIVRDGFFGAFRLVRPDGIKIRLAHEPVFRPSTHPISSLVTAQKPDILLEVVFPGGDQFIWLFDAKYRVHNDDSNYDYAPDDAINQMHRYRDALIYNRSWNGVHSPSRPVFGAFALYPGFCSQSVKNAEQNPYHGAIKEIGIGAFPLVPSQCSHNGNEGSAWLRAFLEEKLGAGLYGSGDADHLYVEDSARIPATGMLQTRYQDLTMVVTGAPQQGRSPEYLQSFRDGSAGWYYMKVWASEREHIPRHVMREVRFCAIAAYDPVVRERKAEWLWRVDGVSLVRRSQLTLEQAGSISSSNDLYWLIKLSSPTRLAKPIGNFPVRGHHLKLCSLKQATDMGDYSRLQRLYSSIATTPEVAT